jgi:hypothetical protein
MKAKYMLISLVAIFVMAPASISGQGITDYIKSKKERAKDRAADKADNKVDQKVDEGVDEVMEGVGNLFRKKMENEEAGSDNGEKEGSRSAYNSDGQAGMSMFSSSGPVDTRDQYTFDYKVHTTMTVYDDNGEAQTSKMVMLYPKDGAYMAADMSTQGGSGIGIFDFENEIMITLMTGRAIVMDLSQYKEQMDEEMDAEEEAGTGEDVSIKKTGRTKTIAGYSCEEYIAEDEEFESEMWMTTELPFNPYESFMDFNESFEGGFEYEKVSGFPMEAT